MSYSVAIKAAIVVLLATICMIVSLGGCGFMAAKPDTPDHQITLGALGVAANIGCDLVRTEQPNVVPSLIDVLDHIVVPLLDQKKPVDAVLALRGFMDTRPAGIRQIGPALDLLMMYLKQRGIIQTDAMYMEAVRAVVNGCRAGLVT